MVAIAPEAAPRACTLCRRSLDDDCSRCAIADVHRGSLDRRRAAAAGDAEALETRVRAT